LALAGAEIPEPERTLLAWWTLDETEGTEAADASGNNHVGTIVGDVNWAPEGGKMGGALELAGTGWVDCGSGDVLAISGPLTIACWINPSNLSGFRAFAGRNGAYDFKSNGTSLRFTTPYILDHDATHAVLKTGTWQHVAVTFQPDVVDGAVFYVNGVEVDRMDASSLRTGTGPFLIGNNQWPDQTYVGLIDDVRVYNYPLAETEVAALYSGQDPATLARVQTPTASAEEPEKTTNWIPVVMLLAIAIVVGALVAAKKKTAS
jgi:hypothetical protein